MTLNFKLYEAPELSEYQLYNTKSFKDLIKKLSLTRSELFNKY